jgi:hypothetical protein
LGLVLVLGQQLELELELELVLVQQLLAQQWHHHNWQQL